MATTSNEAEARRFTSITTANIKGETDQMKALLRELGRISDLKEDWAKSGKLDILKTAAATSKARNDFISAKARVISAAASGAYSADTRAAQADLANLRDNYVKLNQANSAAANNMIQVAQSDGYKSSGGDARAANQMAWQLILDRQSVRNPSLPFTLRGAEDVLGVPSEMGLDAAYMTKYAALKDAADKIDAQTTRAHASLNSPDMLGQMAGGGSPVEMAKQLADLLGPDPTESPLSPELEAEAHTADAMWDYLTKREEKYDAMLENLGGGGDAGEVPGAAPGMSGRNWFTQQQGLGLTEDELAQTMAKPAFQEWAADHGFVVGSGTKDPTTGAWTYQPGKDDVRAIRYAVDQMAGKRTPPRQHLSFTGNEPVSIRVGASTGADAAMKWEDGKYRTVAMPDGTVAYVQPEDGYTVEDEVPAVPATQFAVIDDDSVYVKEPDGKLSLIDPAGVVSSVESAPSELVFAPLYNGKTGAPADTALVIAAITNPDEAEVSVDPLETPASAPQSTPEADAVVAKSTPTTTAPPAEGFNVVGTHVARNPRDPADSMRLNVGGVVHMYQKQADGGYAEIGKKPTGAWDYETSIIEPGEVARLNTRRQRMNDLRRRQAAAMANSEATLPEAADGAVEKQMGRAPAEDETPADVTARATADAAEHVQRLGMDRGDGATPSADPEKAKLLEHYDTAIAAERAKTDTTPTTTAVEPPIRPPEPEGTLAEKLASKRLPDATREFMASADDILAGSPATAKPEGTLTDVIANKTLPEGTQAIIDEAEKINNPAPKAPVVLPQGTQDFLAQVDAVNATTTAKPATMLTAPKVTIPDPKLPGTLEVVPPKSDAAALGGRPSTLPPEPNAVVPMSTATGREADLGEPVSRKVGAPMDMDLTLAQNKARRAAVLAQLASKSKTATATP